MNKKLRLSIFLMLGVLIFVFVLAGCEKIPAKTPDETSNVKAGKLYTLQEALEFSLLTLDDIKQIAYYYNNNLTPEKPLDKEVALKIRETELADLKSKVGLNGELLYPNKSIDDIILEYYGEYNGCYAVLITIKGFAYMDVVSPQSFRDGITINYANPNYIMVWTEKTVKSYGKFYELQEALDRSLLTLDDIKQIANCQNHGLKPNKPLSDDIATKIRQCRVEVYKSIVDADGVQRYPNVSIDDISIYKYYGEYNGCYAVMLKESLGGHGQAPWTDIIDGVEIKYGDRNFILVWTDKPAKEPEPNPSVHIGKFYELQEALDRSLLTLDDIKQIANCQNHGLKPEKPLDGAIARNIRETRAAKLRAIVDDKGLPRYPNASIDDVTITKYYGEYNGCYAVMLDDSYSAAGMAPWTDIIDGVEIIYGDRNFILVWIE